MKAITTIFETMLGQDETLWAPVDGPTECASGPRTTGWTWGG